MTTKTPHDAAPRAQPLGSRPVTISSLDHYRPVKPSPHERTILWHAIDLARALGLRIPRCEIYWIEDEELTEGLRGATFRLERPVRVWLKRGFSDADLFATALHELQHVVDADDPDLDEAEREVRAEQFVIRALAYRRQLARDMAALLATGNRLEVR